jgi:hypothetical protein
MGFLIHYVIGIMRNVLEYMVNHKDMNKRNQVHFKSKFEMQ